MRQVLQKNKSNNVKKYFNANQRYLKIFILFFLLLIISGNLFVNEVSVAPYLLLISVFYLVFELILIKFQEKNFIKYMSELEFCLNGHTKGSLINYPSPLVITDLSGEITWFNDKFAKAVENSELFNVPIQKILPQIQITKFIENQENVKFSIDIGSFVFEVWGNVIYSDDSKESGLIIIYFIDKTDEENAKRLREEEKLVECLVIVDNYDEVLKETPDVNHGSLLGEIEQKIMQWVSSGNGIFRKYERDKNIVLFHQKDFQSILDTKFEILNEIRDINFENKIPVTLSIGIGLNGKDVTENDKFAKLALDMALGRGGDQVVIKDADNFNFYGAKTREVEKRTKVKARVVAHALRELIDDSSFVLIMGHNNPDLDSLGAAIGLFKAVQSRNKNAYIVIDKNSEGVSGIISELEKNNSYEDVFISTEHALNIYTNDSLLIVVDTHRPGMVESSELLNYSENVVIIDHHRRSEDFIENAVLTYHEPYASSTCEMITEILQYIQSSNKLNQKEAEILYAGMFLDTKGFIFKTGVRTFEAASYLRRLGVDPVNVRRLFKSDLTSYTLKAEIISGAQIYRDNIAIAKVETDTSNISVIVAQAADELLDIVDVEASFVLAHTGGRVLISGRSLDNINVQVILEKLGGGGHITIAGTQLENVTLDEAEAMLKDSINSVVFEEEVL